MIEQVWRKDHGNGIAMILDNDGSLWVHEHNQIGLEDADCDNYTIFWPIGNYGEQHD